MGFLLTLFLCNINVLNTMVVSSPKSGGNSTAIIQWILSCLGFISFAILEYALILGVKKFRSALTERVGMGSEENMSHEIQMEEMFKLVDKIMMVVLPLAFSFFIGIFWGSL